MRTGITGIGGACFPEEQGQIHTLDARKTATLSTSQQILNQTEYIHAVKVIRANKERTEFSSEVSLTTTPTIVGIGERNMCKGSYYSMLPGRGVDMRPQGGSANDHGLIYVSSLTQFGGDDPVEKYSSYEEARKVLESEPYQQAFDILASVHYK